MMGKFSSKRNKDFWNEFALTSKDNKFGASGGKHLVDIENQFIFNSLKTKKSKFMIDIGCGNGQRTLLFSKYCSWFFVFSNLFDNLTSSLLSLKLSS